MKIILKTKVITSKKTYEKGTQYTVTGGELETLKKFTDIDAMWKARLDLTGLEDYTELDIEMLKNTEPN